jgi:multimeric flavodoxin WrbA
VKVVAFNGSPKKDGNTYHGIKMVAEELEKEGIEVEIVHVGNKNVRGCVGCAMCKSNKDERCVIRGDEVNEWIQKMKNADGIILASPVYYSAVAGTMKAFLDRATYVSGANGGLFRHKVGASVIAVRRSGGIPAFNELNHYINYSEMIIPTSNYWNVIYGTAPGEALKDEEGTQIMRVLGKNMAWIMKVIDFSKDKIEKPEAEEKVYMNFIR